MSLARTGLLRQQIDLIGYALLVNGLTLLRHERLGRLPAAAWPDPRRPTPSIVGPNERGLIVAGIASTEARAWG